MLYVKGTSYPKNSNVERNKCKGNTCVMTTMQIYLNKFIRPPFPAFFESMCLKIDWVF